MTTSKDLGTRTKVDLRRGMDERASGCFTPWLAENLSELGDALGMELELKVVKPLSVAIRWTSWRVTGERQPCRHRKSIGGYRSRSSWQTAHLCGRV